MNEFEKKLGGPLNKSKENKHFNNDRNPEKSLSKNLSPEALKNLGEVIKKNIKTEKEIKIEELSKKIEKEINTAPFIPGFCNPYNFYNPYKIDIIDNKHYGHSLVFRKNNLEEVDVIDKSVEDDINKLKTKKEKIKSLKEEIPVLVHLVYKLLYLFKPAEYIEDRIQKTINIKEEEKLEKTKEIDLKINELEEYKNAVELKVKKIIKGCRVLFETVKDDIEDSSPDNLESKNNEVRINLDIKLIQRILPVQDFDKLTFKIFIDRAKEYVEAIKKKENEKETEGKDLDKK